MTDKIVNLLWTGGWDSTFRLLELLLIKRRVVRPFYIIDSLRGSMGVELERRDRIRRMLLERGGGVKDLLLPTTFRAKVEIKHNDELSGHYNIARAKLGLGTQHEWLAMCAEEHKLSNFEICNHKNDPAATILEPFVVRDVDVNGEAFYRVDEERADASVYHLFKYFKFPLFPMNKGEIESRAKDYGFMDLMEHTWFCHRPLGQPPMNIRPCGTCNACIYTINTGGIKRLPLRSRINYYFHRLLRPRRIRKLAERQAIFPTVR